MLFATLSAFVVAAVVGQGVGREALTPVASKKIFSGSAIVAFHFSITRTNLPLSCFLRKSEVFNVALFVFIVFYIREFFAFCKTLIFTPSQK
jgi:hypothetical protein